VIDLPKDVLMNKHDYVAPQEAGRAQELQAAGQARSGQDRAGDRADRPRQAAGLLHRRRRGELGSRASKLLAQFVHLTGYPITNTLMGLGTFPASDKQFLGMLGMHGTYEANLAMYNCDVLINIGARFDDRITGKLAEFSPRSKKIHIDIDGSSLNKNVRVDLPIVADAAHALEELVKVWKARQPQVDHKALKTWWTQIDQWRARNCLAYKQGPTRSSRNTRSSGSTITSRTATTTSRPRSASTRCGRRSS
jgi:acetolactate synthase-1/2/3 large subunit